MGNKKKKIISTIGSIICIFLFVFAVIQTKMQENNALTVATGALGEQKIGWGIKREKDHKQPDLGSLNKKLIDQYNGIAMGNAEKPYVYLTFDEGYEARLHTKNIASFKRKPSTSNFFYYSTLLKYTAKLSKAND